MIYIFCGFVDVSVLYLTDVLVELISCIILVHPDYVFKICFATCGRLRGFWRFVSFLTGPPN